jgi:dihydroorotase
MKGYFEGDVLIENDIIVEMQKVSAKSSCAKLMPKGIFIPGAIDDQVHFREPGLTHKGDIESESRAAVAGGITTLLNSLTIPNAVTQEILEQKYDWLPKIIRELFFYDGATNDNLEEVLKTNPKMLLESKYFRFFNRKYVGG